MNKSYSVYYEDSMLTFISSDFNWNTYFCWHQLFLMWLFDYWHHRFLISTMNHIFPFRYPFLITNDILINTCTIDNHLMGRFTWVIVKYSTFWLPYAGNTSVPNFLKPRICIWNLSIWLLFLDFFSPFNKPSIYYYIYSSLVNIFLVSKPFTK